MNQILKSVLPTGGAVLLAVTLAGCGSGEDSAADTPTQAQGDAPELDAVFLAAEPSGAVTVLQARGDATPGKEVTISGRIAGTMDPFTDGYAVFVLGDASIETCEMIPGDECETPWDACCEDPKKLKAGRLSVQVVGADGRPVAKSLKGVNGLKELDTVTVSGTVAQTSTADNMIVTAEGIFRKEG